MVQSHSHNRWVFRRLRNAAKGSTSLGVLGRAFRPELGSRVGKGSQTMKSRAVKEYLFFILL